MSYKFNKYQKAWIKRLKSGKTFKAIGVLEELNKDGKKCRCCLGELVFTLKDEFSEQYKEIKGVDALETCCYSHEQNVVKLNGIREGDIEKSEVSDKWKKILHKEFNIIMEYVCEPTFTLAGLNDGFSYVVPNKKDKFKVRKFNAKPMSHEQIGLFIEENPAAVFISD